MMPVFFLCFDPLLYTAICVITQRENSARNQFLFWLTNVISKLMNLLYWLSFPKQTINGTQKSLAIAIQLETLNNSNAKLKTIIMIWCTEWWLPKKQRKNNIFAFGILQKRLCLFSVVTWYPSMAIVLQLILKFFICGLKLHLELLAASHKSKTT